MSNCHLQSKPRSRALAALLLASVIVSPAVAQEPSLDGLQEPQLVSPGAGAPLPEGASVGDAAEKIKKMSSDSAQALKELVGGSVDNVREKNDIEARTSDQREINKLEMDVKKATLAKQLYQIVNGEEDKYQKELEAAEAERDTLSARVTELEAELEETRKKVVAQTQSQTVDPNPVIVSIVGAGGKLSAKLLVPFHGEVVARRGDVLANGQTVTSITNAGVTVSRDGQSAKLGFGTSVPAARR